MRYEMDRNQGRRQVTITLSARQVAMLAAMCRAKAKKINNQRDMSFVPEPGKRDSNVLAVTRLTTLAKRLESFIKIDEDARPSRA